MKTWSVDVSNMTEIAKRLSFNEHSGGLSQLSETHQAARDLRRAQQDLSQETRRHGQDKLQEARNVVDNGAGENDLKRLQRKFQATKASYINVDVKERFMQSLRDGSLDVEKLEEDYKGHEEQLQHDADVLRALKDQNGQARQTLHDTSAQIATLHQQFDQVIGDVAAQLDMLERSLQQFEANRPPPLEPLGPGTDQVECDALLQQEMARAKQLEASIASSEAAIQESEPRVRSGAQELASLQDEVARLSVLQADKAKAADATAYVSRATFWAEAAAAAVEALGGLSIHSIEEDRLVVKVVCWVPTSLASGAPLRELCHELSLQLRPGSSHVASARLTPAIVPIDDVVAAAAGSGGAGMRTLVREVHTRLLQYWSLQAQVEAAAERFPIVRVDQQRDDGQAAPHKVLEASMLGRFGAKVRVAVPQEWPQLGGGSGDSAGAVAAESRSRLRVVGASGAGLDAAALVAQVEGDDTLAGADLLSFLEGVAGHVDKLVSPNA